LLGPNSTVTDKEIEDAVWYYYFDVDKTVKYLQRTKDFWSKSNAKFIPGKSGPTPVKEKQENKTKSRFDMAAEAASQRTPQGTLQLLALSYML
jgi:HBS1 N-terminus